jgi:hypothetical protein
MGKKTQSNPARKCVCKVCKITAQSIPQTTHRRCPGQIDLPIRGKNDRIQSALRGTWI